MSRPKILVLHNEPTLPADHPDADSEHDILDTADAVMRHLQDAGLNSLRFGFVDDPHALIRALDDHKPDAVFNLYEGTATWGSSEAYVASILEMLRVPFTGSPTQPLILARSKPLTKQLFAGAGLPTAPFVILEGDEAIPANTLGWPVIVKPGREDASVGIEQSSVCTDQDHLVKRVDYLRKTYGPTVLVEAFVRGREFHVPVWDRGDGPQVLPFTEIFFLDQGRPDSLWPIVSFDAKWKPESADYKATPAKNPAEVDSELQERVAKVALAAFDLLGCRDYARMDFRVADDGTPYLLEVNPNPCISPLAGIAEALQSSAIPFKDFVLDLVKAALRRGSRPDLAAFDNSIPNSTPPVAAPTVGDISATDSDAFAIAVDRAHAGRIAVMLYADQKQVSVLSDIQVEPAFRRRGLATHLLAHLEQHLKAKGVRLVLAELSSHAVHAPLRQFLAARGFRPAGEVPEFHADGASRLTYSKTLTPPNA